MQKRQILPFLATLFLTACSLLPAPSTTPAGEVAAEAPAAAAAQQRVLTSADWSDLPGWQQDSALAAWPAFLESCKALPRRPGMAVWGPVCVRAQGIDGRQESAVRAFFETELRPYQLRTQDGQAEGMVTGYYEPLLTGSRTPGRRFAHPVHAVPEDMLTIELGDLFPELKGKRVRGRLAGNKVLPYWTREELLSRQGRLPLRALAYVDDPIELFFLQIQGSGRIRLPDGSLLRVNYADQNGHPYRSIGRLLVERGDLKLEEASMQGIQAWARANPQRLDELLNSNPSYVFFREMPASDAGPIGALGVPLTAERSIAIDPRFVPLGAPVFLATTRPNASVPMNRLVLAQDVGGAIKGVVRADYFWGFGHEAGALAGRMKQRGQMWLLWPRGAHPEAAGRS